MTYLPRMGLGMLYCMPSGVVALSLSGSAACGLRRVERSSLAFLPDVPCSKCEAFRVREDVVEEYRVHSRVLGCDVFAEDVLGYGGASAFDWGQ